MNAPTWPWLLMQDISASFSKWLANKPGAYLQAREAAEEIERDYLAHEALDRCSILENLVSTELLGHPYIQENPETLKLVNRAAEALADAYQLIGEKHL